MTPLHPDFLRIPLAHRGLHERAMRRIENAPASFAAAVDAGYGIELDVQLSSDGQAMVFHDFVLDRLTAATGPVAAKSAQELGSIVLAGSGDTIPTLPAVLAQVSGQVPLLIEIKDQSQCLGPARIGPLEQAVADALQAYSGPVAVMSFNPHSILALANLAPGICRGLTTGDFNKTEYPEVDQRRLDALDAIEDFDAAGCAFVSHYIAELDHPRIQALRSAGVPVLCWTVKSEDQESRARATASNITFEGYLAKRPVA